MQYTDFIKALFTLKILNGFMVNVNAISHTPIRKVWPPHATLHEVHMQQHYVQISYTEFHQNQVINMQGTTINSLIPSNKVHFFTVLIFSKLIITQ
jgi:hypothetical protein